MSKLMRLILSTVVHQLPELETHLHPHVLELLERRYKSTIKAAGDISAINRVYHDAITRELLAYFDGGPIGSSRNGFKQATITAFSDAFDSGWLDGGAELPVSDDALDWIEARIAEEFGYIEALFEQAKELRRDRDFDYFRWITARADGYTNTLREIYNQARLMVMTNVMVTFTGESGKEPCKDCKRLYGKRHKLSWFIKNDVVPPAGGGLECSPGGHCKHRLVTDAGEVLTI